MLRKRVCRWIDVEVEGLEMDRVLYIVYIS